MAEYKPGTTKQLKISSKSTTTTTATFAVNTGTLKKAEGLTPKEQAELEAAEKEDAVYLQQAASLGIKTKARSTRIGLRCGCIGDSYCNACCGNGLCREPYKHYNWGVWTFRIRKPCADPKHVDWHTHEGRRFNAVVWLEADGTIHYDTPYHGETYSGPRHEAGYPAKADAQVEAMAAEKAKRKRVTRKSTAKKTTAKKGEAK